MSGVICKAKPHGETREAERERRRREKKKTSTAAISDSYTSFQLTKVIVIMGTMDLHSKLRGRATETLSNKLNGQSWVVSCHKCVFEHGAMLGSQFTTLKTKRWRKRETQLLIHLFICTYYSGHALPGTNRRADKCKHTNVHVNKHTYTHTQLFFLFCHSPCLSNVVSAHCIKIRSANTHMHRNRC